MTERVGSIDDRAWLARMLADFSAAGIAEVFAVSGDAARPLRRLVRSWRTSPSSDGRFALGVAGYPEGHPDWSVPELLDALEAKQHLASSLVTQMCFSATAIADYVAFLRCEGVS